jgi:hypothetical protein
MCVRSMECDKEDELTLVLHPSAKEMYSPARFLLCSVVEGCRRGGNLVIIVTLPSTTASLVRPCSTKP